MTVDAPCKRRGHDLQVYLALLNRLLSIVNTIIGISTIGVVKKFQSAVMVFPIKLSIDNNLFSSFLIS